MAEKSEVLQEVADRMAKQLEATKGHTRFHVRCSQGFIGRHGKHCVGPASIFLGDRCSLNGVSGRDANKLRQKFQDAFDLGVAYALKLAEGVEHG